MGLLGLPDSVLDDFAEKSGFRLEETLLYACRIGPNAQGTFYSLTGGSYEDTTLAVVVPPRVKVYGLNPWDEHEYSDDENEDNALEVWSVRKFVADALKGDPSMQCMLWVQPKDQLFISPAFRPILDLKKIFASRAVCRSLIALGSKGFTPQWRSTHAEAEMIRFLRMAIEFAIHEELQVSREKDSKILVGIKSGRYSRDDVMKFANKTFAEATQALVNSKLPESPDESVAESLMMHAMQDMWKS